MTHEELDRLDAQLLAYRRKVTPIHAKGYKTKKKLKVSQLIADSLNTHREAALEEMMMVLRSEGFLMITEDDYDSLLGEAS